MTSVIVISLSLFYKVLTHHKQQKHTPKNKCVLVISQLQAVINLCQLISALLSCLQCFDAVGWVA